MQNNFKAFWQSLDANWPQPLLAINGSGELVAYSDQAEQALQLSELQPLGKSAHQVLCVETYGHSHPASECPLNHPDKAFVDLEQKSSIFSSVWQRGDDRHCDVDFRLLRFPLLPDAHYIVSFELLSDHLSSQAALSKLARFSEINPSPFLEYDPRGLISFANPVMTDLMLQHGFDDEGTPNVLMPNIKALAQQCLQSKNALNNIEVECEGRYFLWQFHPHHQTNNDSVLVCGIDITEQKRAEITAKEFENRLQQEREKARVQYVAKMVHDLRSPLNSVVGFASMLRKKASDKLSDKEQSMLNKIINGGKLLSEQITKNLQLARVESAMLSAEFAHHNIAQIASSVIDSAQSLVHKKPLKLTLEPSDLVCQVDQVLLNQALYNLVSNAIKYSDAGTITVAIKPCSEGFYRIDVRDEGPGLSDSELASVFSLFQRAEKHKSSDIEGEGLGLAIVNDIAKLHGGYVEANSTPGVGSCFSIVLPIDNFNEN